MRSEFRVHTSTAAVAAALAWAVSATCVRADTLSDIGVTQLRAEVPTLTGAGVVVAQAEAAGNQAGTAFELNNANTSALVTYLDQGSDTLGNTFPTTTYDPALNSWHADAVAAQFFATGSGVATGVSQVLNINANYYQNAYIVPNNTILSSLKIINQSFVDRNDTAPYTPLAAPYTQAVVDQLYDSYVAAHNVIIVTAAGNGPSGDPAQDMPQVQTPGTAYNVITVGALGITPGSTGTPDGRHKPDITAPGNASSFTTPLVSGVAALLVQAGNTNKGGFGTATSAVDPRTVKALLLNGATKPADWTHSAAVPLDPQYGAGVVNAYNSYHNLTAGRHSASSTGLTGGIDVAHGAVSGTNVGAEGWNFFAITSSTGSDAVDHYTIDVSGATGNLTLTATLIWQRADDQALTAEILASPEGTTAFSTPVNTINNLDLYLYNINTQSLVDLSTSTVDNVEHLYELNLAPGKYDLQVLKHGGSVGTANVFSDSEAYALAWNVVGPGIAPVPEPASMLILAAGGLLALRRRPRSRNN